MNAILDPFNEFASNTVDNPAEFQLKTRFFKGGYVDLVVHRIKHRISKFHKDNFVGTMTLHTKTLTDDELEAKRQDNIRRSVDRSKQQVQFAVRQIQADHMLTLSTRENIQDRDYFYKLYKEFIRLVRHYDYANGQLEKRLTKRLFAFVAVPELQDRGAYHMHIAVNGKQDLNLLRSCWYVALGGSPSDKGPDTRGQIDVTSQHRMFGTASEKFKTMKLVQYLCKYMVKSFDIDDSMGLKRYTRSDKIERPKVLKQYLVACYSNGQQDFVDAMKEAISIADFYGIGTDFQLFSRGTDLFILRGQLL